MLGEGGANTVYFIMILLYISYPGTHINRNKIKEGLRNGYRSGVFIPVCMLQWVAPITVINNVSHIMKASPLHHWICETQSTMLIL